MVEVVVDHKEFNLLKVVVVELEEEEALED